MTLALAAVNDAVAVLVTDSLEYLAAGDGAPGLFRLSERKIVPLARGACVIGGLRRAGWRPPLLDEPFASACLEMTASLRRGLAVDEVRGRDGLLLRPYGGLLAAGLVDGRPRLFCAETDGEKTTSGWYEPPCIVAAGPAAGGPAVRLPLSTEVGSAEDLASRIVRIGGGIIADQFERDGAKSLEDYPGHSHPIYAPPLQVAIVSADGVLIRKHGLPRAALSTP